MVAGGDLALTGGRVRDHEVAAEGTESRQRRDKGRGRVEEDQTGCF
jgi:hypothetical protein